MNNTDEKSYEFLNNGRAERRRNFIQHCISSHLVNTIVRRRFQNFSSAITNRLWLNAHQNYECDVLITFPSDVDDFVIIWFLEQLLQLAPDIRISIKYHFTTGKRTWKSSFLIPSSFRCLRFLCHIYLRKVKEIDVFLRFRFTFCLA